MIRTRRVNAYVSAPDAMDALLRLNKTIEGSGLESSLINLVKIRASQINRCALCIDLHTRHARAAGGLGRLFVRWPSAISGMLKRIIKLHVGLLEVAGFSAPVVSALAIRLCNGHVFDHTLPAMG